MEETARGKAAEVASRLGDREDWVVVIGADTVVVRQLPSTHLQGFVGESVPPKNYNHSKIHLSLY